MGSRIAIIGTGYVGLTTGACLAHSGTRRRVRRHRPGQGRAAQPGRRADPRGRPRRPGAARVCARASSRFVLGSPSAVARRRVRVPLRAHPAGRGRLGRPRPTSRTRPDEIGPHLQPEAVVINKSTVPVGSTRVVERALGRDDVFVVSNPEFLREGSAVHDFLNPDRVVIGADDQAAAIRVAGALPRPRGPVAWSPTRRRPRRSSTRATPSWPPRSASSTPSPRCARRSAPTSTTSCSAWATTSASATSSSGPARAAADRASPRTPGRWSASPRTRATTSICSRA